MTGADRKWIRSTAGVLAALILLGFAAPAAAQDLLIRGGTVLTITDGDLPETDVLIRDGRIAQIGQGLRPNRGMRVIEAEGRYVLPGIIDDHSHMAIEGGINEGSRSVVAEVNISDVIRHDDISLFTALAGGVTTINTMHGSANAIGGQNETFKLKWGRPWQQMVFEGAPQTLKFALGENVRQSRNPEGTRYPRTRSGVAEVYREAFMKARAYRAAWERYEAARARGEDPIPPRRDLQMEVFVKVMEGEIIVICHSYRADEIAMLMEVFNEFDIPPGTFTHVLEGFKVAPEMARNGWGASAFADMWAYKIEAYDAPPHKLAIMYHHGVRTAINSDSAERVRRLYQEAARAVKYGGVPENEALKMFTLNPAINLGIDDRVGSIEVGKDGDIAIFSDYPLRAAARCEMTIIDGEVFFDRSQTDTAMGWVGMETDGGGPR
jgi:imidazolonepropionase-like amidohydrolase